MTYVIIIVATIIVAVTLYISTSLLHVYAYFVLVSACTSILVQTRVSNLIQWALFLLIWWNVSFYLEVSTSILVLIFIIIVEFFYYLSILKVLLILTKHLIII